MVTLKTSLVIKKKQKKTVDPVSQPLHVATDTVGPQRAHTLFLKGRLDHLLPVLRLDLFLPNKKRPAWHQCIRKLMVLEST